MIENDLMPIDSKPFEPSKVRNLWAQSKGSASQLLTLAEVTCATNGQFLNVFFMNEVSPLQTTLYHSPCSAGPKKVPPVKMARMRVVLRV